MPNWCQNILSVAGGEEDIKRFKELARPKDLNLDSDLALESLYPIPAHKDWYDWCSEHWGTKWDIKAKLDQPAIGLLDYRFNSAWSPPIAWVEIVAKRFKSLEFVLSYYGPGVGFSGCVIFDQGKLKDRWHHDYS